MQTNHITDSESDVGTLVKAAIGDLERLATQHIKLFQTELKQDAAKAGQGIIALVIGLNVLSIGAVLLAAALALGMSAMFDLPWWAGFLVVGILVAAAGGISLFLARERFGAATPVVEKTREELEEDAKWLTNPK
jgi:tetrahydromethanopterin S-methyltransferase subunit C